MSAYDRFLAQAEEKAFDPGQRKEKQERLHQRSDLQQRLSGYYSNLDLARSRAAYIRQKTLDNLEKHLLDFESAFQKKGGKVIWAQQEKDVWQELARLADKKGCSQVFMQDGPLAREIQLEVGLNREKVTIFGQGPFDMAITEQAWMIAEGGLLGWFEEDVKVRQHLHHAKTQVFLTTIERLVPNMVDFELISGLYSNYALGQSTPSTLTLLSGPDAYPGRELVLVVLDNGRSDLLAQPEQRQALSCIQCGACSDVCPVTRLAGERAYEAVYSGPIGSVTVPYLKQQEDYSHLSFASTLCGRCTEVCPVKIDLPRLLHLNRRDYIANGTATKKENLGLYFWKNAMLKRSSMEKGGPKVKAFMLKQFFRKDWGNRRDFPELASKSFNQQWRERKGMK
jgi:L-lactate dehydrogenase complex protein LldF